MSQKDLLFKLESILNLNNFWFILNYCNRLNCIIFNKIHTDLEREFPKYPGRLYIGETDIWSYLWL